jgi:four helix bundle protein
MEFSERIWKIVKSWPRFDQETVGKQLVRAADSVSANLNEGTGRFTFKERNQFYIYARGSLTETSCWLEKAYSRDLIKEEDYHYLTSTNRRILFQLNKIIRQTRSQ